MKTSLKVKECLLEAAGAESHAVVQYKADAAIVDNWGLSKLGEKFTEEAEDEGGHLKSFCERLAFVEGDLSIEVESSISRKSITDVIKGQLSLEAKAVSDYQKYAKEAWDTGDVGTSHLFASILKDEECHLNWLEGQKALLDSLGEKCFIEMWATK